MNWPDILLTARKRCFNWPTIWLSRKPGLGCRWIGRDSHGKDVVMVILILQIAWLQIIWFTYKGHQLLDCKPCRLGIYPHRKDGTKRVCVLFKRDGPYAMSVRLILDIKPEESGVFTTPCPLHAHSGPPMWLRYNSATSMGRFACDACSVTGYITGNPPGIPAGVG